MHGQCITNKRVKSKTNTIAERLNLIFIGENEIGSIQITYYQIKPMHKKICFVIPANQSIYGICGVWIATAINV